MVKALYGFGFFLLIGTPIILTIATLVQAPSSPGHTGLGANLVKLVVANFASLPFMTVGGILVIIAVVKNRRPKAGQGTSANP